MRVLQIHNRYALPGGEDTISDYEAASLRDAGHTVDTYRVDNSAGAKAIPALAGAAWNPSQARRLTRHVASFAPDVSHLHNTWFTLSPNVFHALAARRVPIVMTLQNYRLLCGNALFYRDGGICTDCLHGSHWQVVSHACYRESRPESAVAALTMSVAQRRRTWQLVDRFLAPSQFVKDIFVEAGFDADRLVVRPNMVPDPGERASAPSQSRDVLVSGRISVEKGHDTLLAAWREAQPEGLRLVVVGDGPLRASLETQRVPGVEFAGWVDQATLAGMLLSARASVLPSQWLENFGRIVIESMGAGCPVLASKIATPAEVVGEIGPEWVVEPRDHDEWVQRLRGLADDAHVDAGGRRARELWSAKYCEPVGRASLEAVYRSLLP